MARSSARKEDQLAADIRRQFGDGATARLARTLPTFKVVSEIPEHLRILLERLECAENSSRGGGR
jgi:hypothetical protein